MATYLQGITDQVNVINPPQIDAQFEMQLLQARQSRYDQAHAQVSKLYSSILNSSLSRTDNKEARDEFFKLIEKDIKKIAQTDLSLESNAKAAKNLFSQIYDNDYLVKDMVWTKNYQDQLRVAEGFKNCLKPEDCGGMYWDEGVRYMQYKREEFQNASREESMYAQDVEYIPYNSLMDEALKYAKEADFEITQDAFDGNYIITTTNGELATGPLTVLFAGTLRNNPKLLDVFKVEEYNKRNDWMRQQVRDKKYNTLNEARVGYLKENYDVEKEAFTKIYNENNVAKEDIEKRIKILENINNKQGGLTDSQLNQYNIALAELNDLQRVTTLLEDVKKTNDYINTDLAQTNIESVLRVYDQMNAITRFDSQLQLAVDAMAMRKYSQTRKADDFAKMQKKFEYDVRLESIKQANRIELEKTKAIYDSKKAKNQKFIEVAMTDIDKAVTDYKDGYDEKSKLAQALKAAGLDEKMTANYSSWEQIGAAMANMADTPENIKKFKEMSAAEQNIAVGTQINAWTLFKSEYKEQEKEARIKKDEAVKKHVTLAQDITNGKYTEEDIDKFFSESGSLFKPFGEGKTVYDTKWGEDDRKKILNAYKKAVDAGNMTQEQYNKFFKDYLTWTKLGIVTP